MLKKIFGVLLCACLLVCVCFINTNRVEASADYMSSEDARNFLAFIYNSNTDKMTHEALANDEFYKLLTGGLSGNGDYELATTAAFLSFMETRIIYTLSKVGAAVNTSRDYLIKYFENALENETNAMVTGIFKENVLKSIYNMCGGDEVYELADGISNAAENPNKYLEDVYAITSALAYTYGQNVVSLYTYFDAAMSCVYLKSTPGAYEMAMSYNIMALRESNFMSYATLLIPGITSWEEWIEDMDYWAEYVDGMRGDVVAGNTGESHYVIFHPNCDDMEIQVNRQSTGTLLVPRWEREGYVLAGWYFDEECTNGPITSDYVVSENIVVYAKWVDRYLTITFDSNCPEVEDYTYEYDILDGNWHMPEMKRAGHSFKGWYWDSDCKNSAAGTITLDRDLTFYAGWTTHYNAKITNGKAQLITVTRWNTDENGNIITDVEIPYTLGSYPVESVDVTNWQDTLTGITFSDNVERIVAKSFDYFDKLRYAKFGSAVKTIEENAFYQCSNLESVTLNEGLLTIGKQAFYYCTSLDGVVIPSTVTSIGDSAFTSSGLTEIVLPDSVVSLGKAAFSSCWSLEHVEIGKGVANIPADTFLYCSGLREIVVSPDNPSYTTVDGVLYNKDMTVLIKYPATKADASFTVPDTVKTIEANAFYYCINLKEIKMGSNVESIGESAFYECSALVSATLPADMTAIPDYIFESCSSLESVTFPSAPTSIGNSAFSHCASLKSIDIPSTVKSIGSGAFQCSGLESIVIPDSVTDIGDSLFFMCSSLKSAVLPESMTSIGWGMFYECVSLESITLPKNLMSIGDSAFYRCESLTDFIIPESVESIGWMAFNYCSSLTCVKLPSAMTTLGGCVFDDCENLTSIIIPKTLTEISDDAFFYVPSLTDVYYTGSAAEWNKISISEYGNEDLANATVHYDTTLVADISAKLSDNTVSGAVSYSYVSENYSVYVGLYDGLRLIGARILTIGTIASPTTFDFTVNKEGAYTVKAFFWSGDKMSPKAESISNAVTLP